MKVQLVKLYEGPVWKVEILKNLLAKNKVPSILQYLPIGSLWTGMEGEAELYIDDITARELAPLLKECLEAIGEQLPWERHPQKEIQRERKQ